MKKKKIVFIILPILLILIVVAVLIALYLMTDMFKSNDVLFAKYFSQNGEVFDILQNANVAEQNTFKNNSTYTLTGDLTTTIQTGTNSQELRATTSARHDANTGRTYSEITLKNGDVDTLKLSYINSEDVYAIKCDDVMSNYIGFRNSELKQFAQNMGMTESEAQSVPDSINFSAIGEIASITEEQKQHIINTYSKVISESISADKYVKLDKTQISVEGTSYETNAYQVVLDGNTLKQIIMNCLTTLKNDNATLVLISNKLTDLGLGSEYTDITKISEMIENLSTQVQNANNIAYSLVITVYEHEGKTIKTEIEMNLNETENIESLSNETMQNEAIVSSTNTSNISKLTIDKLGTETISQAIVTVEQNQTTGITQNVITGETTEGTTQTTISQLILQKNVTDTNTTNTITFIPDTSNTAQSITINKTIGKLVNNTATNSSDFALSISSDGINVQTIQSNYTQNMQVATEVEEIMELKNSNTVIFNNYTSAQLIPYLTQIGQRAAEVIPSKLAQLGIDVTMSQEGTGTNAPSANIANATNNIYNVLQIAGASSVSIANANGVNTEGIAVVGGVAVGVYVYNQSNSIINSAQDANEQVEQQMVIENQLIENTQIQMNEVLGQYNIQ